MIVLIRIQDAFIALPLQSYGNSDSIRLFLHGYELFWTSSCSFELAMGELGGCGQFRMGGCRQSWVVGIVSGGFRWFWMVSDGLGWFRLVCCFSGYVFRIYETRKKFNCVIHTTSEKKPRTIRDLSSSLTEIFDGFHIVKIEAENNFKTLYSPIDIAYDPVKHFKIKINCFFLTNKCLDYRSRSIVDKKGKKIQHGKALQCYYCSNVYIRKVNCDKEIKHCSDIPVILYNFNTQTLITFEDNLNYKRGLHFVAYSEFETTASNSSQTLSFLTLSILLFIQI